MRRGLAIFLIIISVFVLYTADKIAQLWPDHPWASVGLSVILFVLMLSGTILYRSNADLYDKPWFRVLSWSGSIAMSVWATLFILSIPVDILDVLTYLGGHAIPALKVPDESRNAFVNSVYVFLAVASLIMAVIGFIEVRRGARVKETKIPVANLKPSLRGFKIAQITDLHVGTTIRTDFVREVVRRTNAVNPDVIVFTGDIVDAHPSSVVEHIKPLAHLKAKYGCYFVTGNHEYFWGADEIVELIRAAGIRPLMNENAVIPVGDATLMIAGVTDSRPQTVQALTGAADFKILLKHKPGVDPRTEELGTNLQLAGHTHAGQFFPFSLFIGFAHRYSRGLYTHGRMWVYVNPGTGYWGPANRFAIRPEISLLTLI